MEKDKNPFPEINITPLDVIRAVGDIAYRLCSFLPSEAPDYMSTHYRGGATLLDRELYDVPEETQMMLDYGTLEE